MKELSLSGEVTQRAELHFLLNLVEGSSPSCDLLYCICSQELQHPCGRALAWSALVVDEDRESTGYVVVHSMGLGENLSPRKSCVTKMEASTHVGMHIHGQKHCGGA